MSAVRKGIPARDPKLPALLPPRIAPIPPGFKLRDPDDPTPCGDQSITLDEEDERILDKVWAEVARHPRMAADQDEAPTNGPDRRPDGRHNEDGLLHKAARDTTRPASRGARPYRNRQASPKE